MKAQPLTFRAEPAATDNLDRLCEATERDRAYHLRRALDEYLERQLWQIQKIEEGIRAADAGEVAPLDEIKASWERKAD